MNLPQREGAVQEREAGAKHRRTQTLRGTLARGPPAELPAAETEGKEGGKKKKKAVTQSATTQLVQPRRGGRTGQDVVPFPQTSSSNLHNNLHLPRSAPGIRVPELRERRGTFPEGPHHPKNRVPLGAPRLGSRSRPRPGSGLGEGGWVWQGGRPERRPPPLPGVPRVLPSRAPRPALAAPRVTSGQIQRDVLLAAVIPPCAKQTHNPN
jgi:hypothetical protein